MICPHCKHEFKLTWKRYLAPKRYFLSLQSCPSCNEDLVCTGQVKYYGFYLMFMYLIFIAGAIVGFSDTYLVVIFFLLFPIVFVDRFVNQRYRFFQPVKYDGRKVVHDAVFLNLFLLYPAITITFEIIGALFFAIGEIIIEKTLMIPAELFYKYNFLVVVFLNIILLTLIGIFLNKRKSSIVEILLLVISIVIWEAILYYLDPGYPEGTPVPKFQFAKVQFIFHPIERYLLIAPLLYLASFKRLFAPREITNK